MRIGGGLEASQQRLEAVLVSANAGTTPFPTTGWVRSQWSAWVIDLIGSKQRQRVGTGEPFIREAETVAIYRPRTRYDEWQVKGRSQYEAWVIFQLSGGLAESFTTLVGKQGFCHVRDPDGTVAGLLREIAEIVHGRQPGHAILAQAAFLALVGRVALVRPDRNGLWEVADAGTSRRRSPLAVRVEKFVRARVDQPIRVPELARAVGMSLSSFAHAYPAEAGETPRCTIARLKMEAAKRLLVAERLSVKETASRLGYATQFEFSRAFKRIEGKPPKTYAAQMNIKHGLRRRG